MPVSRERFAQGLSPEQFLQQIDRNQERFEQNIREVQGLITDKDREFFARHPVNVVAIGEGWCTDVVQFFPPMFELAKQSPNVKLGVFVRDQNTDLIDQYLNQGKYRSIPVFVFYDQDWNELAHFIERPAAVTQEMAKETLRFAQENAQLEGINRTYENMPDETRTAVRENNANYRWSNMLRWDRIFLDDIEDLIARGARQPQPAAAAAEQSEHD
ncbi:MAG TPA: thioredoxin family protein [Thermomicrobiaceae bacterium]|nr:thioredoxin family protein [Thermomicrobiaceae bacterium]